MAQKTDRPVKLAVLDLYEGIDNEGIPSILKLLNWYKETHNLNLSLDLFDVRGKNEMAGTDYDIYISSGGPGSPVDSEGSEWENKFFSLMDKLEDHNLSNTPQKKHVLFICHSFQLMCRKYKLGLVNQRKSASFGVLPVHKTKAGKHDLVFDGLGDPFHAVDSREWQVIEPDEKRFTELGMQLLAIEKLRPTIPLPRAMMAIRYSDYFFGTQFHPEASPEGMRILLAKPEEKKDVVDEHGLDKYNAMLDMLDDEDKLIHTQKTIIPNFLDNALLNMQD